jgi:hypothetical protein
VTPFLPVNFSACWKWFAVVNACPNLSDAIRVRILAMAKAASERSG